VTLQTRAAENFRSCRWGDEQTCQVCADVEQGSLSARAEIFRHFLENLILSVSPYIVNTNKLYFLYYK
jgi:putative ribosome biogenesis GTPase RsgA